MARTLSDIQEHKLKSFEQTYRRYKAAEIEAHTRHQRLAEEEIAAARLEASVAGREAVEAGVPVTHLGRLDREGMRTRDWATVRRFINEAPPSIEETEHAEQPHTDIAVELVDGADMVRVTLSGGELAEALVNARWDGGIRPATGHVAAEFKRHQSGRWVPVTDSWCEDVQEQHPVVAWSVSDAAQQKITESVEAQSK